MTPSRQHKTRQTKNDRDENNRKDIEQNIQRRIKAEASRNAIIYRYAALYQLALTFV